MVAIVAESMREGAFGLSTGLFYVPGAFARTSEVVALARAVGRAGRHSRLPHARRGCRRPGQRPRDGDHRRAGGPAHPDHPPQDHRPRRAGVAASRPSASSIEARRRGVDVTVDQYPYTASSTSFSAALFPAWALEGDDEARARPPRRPRDPPAGPGGGRSRRSSTSGAAATPPVCRSRPSPTTRPSTAGRWPAVLLERGREATVDEAADLVLEIVENGGATGIFHAMSEEDVERILASPFTMVASDGEIPVFGQGRPHPRSYGTFARVLGVYVREKGLLPLEEAVRKMTSLPAARVGLDGPRPRPARDEGRPRGLRPRDDPGPGDLRGAPRVRRGGVVRGGERLGGRGRRAPDRRAPGPRPARPGAGEGGTP